MSRHASLFEADASLPPMNAGALTALLRSRHAQQQHASCETLQLQLADPAALSVLTASLQLPLEESTMAAQSEPHAWQGVPPPTKPSASDGTNSGPAAMAIEGGNGAAHPNSLHTTERVTSAQPLARKPWRGGWSLLSNVLALAAYPTQCGHPSGGHPATEAELLTAVQALAISPAKTPTLNTGLSSVFDTTAGAQLTLRDYHATRMGPYAVQRASLSLTAALLDHRALALLTPLLTGEAEERAAVGGGSGRPASGASGCMASGGGSGGGAGNSNCSGGVGGGAEHPPGVLHEGTGMGLSQRLMAMLDAVSRSPAGGLLEGFQLPPSVPAQWPPPIASSQSAAAAPINNPGGA